LVLEVGMADLIFKNLTPDHIQRLEEIISNEPESSNTTIFEINHEVTFHSTLYEISGNKTLKEFQKMLLPVFGFVHSSGILQKSIEVDTFASHKDLVAILKTGTPEEFRNAMRNHLQNHYRRLGINY